MEFAEDEVVRLVAPDLSGAFAEVAGVQVVVARKRSDLPLDLLAAEPPGIRLAGVFGAT